MQQRTRHAYGFTLLEISIVLVIIGLLAASILVGSELIRQAELRSVITGVERYNTAANTFRAKYNCLPGDCASATDFFGVQVGCPHPVVTSGSENPLTCNGNGTGTIWAETEPGELHERVRFWQHLSAAGLAEQFSGIGHTALGEPIATQAIMYGFNAPKTKLAPTGLVVYHGSTMNFFGLEYFKPLTNSHILVLGSNEACDDTACVTNGDTVSGAHSGVSPETALILDSKVDDGKPGGGAITAPPRDGGFGTSWLHCTTGLHTEAETAVYNTSVKTAVCPLFFQAAF